MKMGDTYMTPRQRVVSSMVSSIAGLIVISVLMSEWAPARAVLGWTLIYSGVSVSAWIFVLRGSERVEEWWSTAVGLIFGLLPVSAVVWDPGGKSYWITTAMVLAAIANEVSSLPYIRIGEWRVGVGLASIMTVGAGLFEVGIIALVALPIFGVIISNGQRMRALKDALEISRSAAEEETAQAKRMAVCDELTGLLNRRGISQQFSQPDTQTILMIDVDRLKAVNDAHGYAAGDQVIQQVAAVLQERLGDRWVLGRQGGDEFLAITSGDQVLDPQVCEPVSCRVSLYGTPTDLTVGLSGGVVVSHGTESSDRLLSKAGFAMRSTKRAGGGLARFDDVLATRFDQMLEISVHSTDEVAAASLVSDFQIIVDESGKIIGCEALARWRRDDGSLVPPSIFVPLLAENGQMPDLNKAMLTKAVVFASQFRNLAEPPFVAVNITSSSLGTAGLTTLISSLLSDYDVAPEQLMIEVTETEGLVPEASWEAGAAELKALGVRLAIDDFGSGYSNIERLGQLPISHLKFDRSLTSASLGPVTNIVQGVVDFATQAGIGIIAEGIETPEQLLAMRSMGFRIFQGYFFGRPTSAATVADQIFSSHRMAEATASTAEASRA